MFRIIGNWGYANGGITTDLSQFLKQKVVTTPNASEDAEKLAHSFLVGI